MKSKYTSVKFCILFICKILISLSNILHRHKQMYNYLHSFKGKLVKFPVIEVFGDLKVFIPENYFKDVKNP